MEFNRRHEMSKSEIVKLQAIAMVFLMVTSGLMVMIAIQSDDVKGEDTYHSGTWIIEDDTTIEAGDTVYVTDVDGNTDPIFLPHTGVVIGDPFDPEGATLTVEGTLVIEEGSLWVGGRDPPMFTQPFFGHLVVDGGTIRFETNGDETYSINGNDPIEIYDGTIQNNGTHHAGSGGGPNTDVFRFIVNSSLTISDSLIEDLSASQVIIPAPALQLYPGGIHLKHPTVMAGEIFYDVQDTVINNSKVGMSFENAPDNKGYFENITFNNIDTHLNFTGSAPTFINCTVDEDWVIWIQDGFREDDFLIETNASHPTMVNCGDVDKDDVDLYFGGGDPEPIPMFTESTLNVSAMIYIIVRDQAGNPVKGASIQVNASSYNLASGPDHGKHIGQETVFDNVTNSSGIAAGVAVPLYSIYGHTTFSPPNLSQTKYSRSRSEWNTTASFSGESTIVNNDTADPIEIDTENIIVVLNLKPQFGARPIYYTGPAIAGNRIEFFGSVKNYGSMGAYCTVSYYNSSIDEDHLLDRFTNVFIEPGETWRSEAVRPVNWTTTRSMGDQWYTIYCIVTDLSGYEALDKKRDNNRTLEVFLERPTPEMDVDIRFDNNAPIDGDIVTIFTNITNVGLAEADDIHVSFWLGDPQNGGIQIGANQTFSNLDVGEYNNATNVTWNTLHMGNDTRFNTTLGQTFVTHNIYMWVEYNNIEDPNPLKTKNNTEMKDLDVNKFYDVDFQPAAQFDYINEELPYTVYAYSIQNIGRAVDSFEFDVDAWASNATHLDNWSFVLYSDDYPDLLADGGKRILLQPGEMVIIYVNVSALWEGIDQGDLFITYINVTSVNSTMRKMMVKASTSAGTVDYTPTEITFRREDGVRVFNEGTTPDSDLKSLVANETSTLTVQIKNEGTAGSVFSFNVTFYVDVFGSPIPIGSTTFSDYIPAGFSETASIEYIFTTPGQKKISVQVDSLNDIGELKEDNNWFNATIYVKEEAAYYDFSISGIVFDWDGQTPLPGATIRLSNTVSGYIDTATTDAKGKYTIVIPKESYSDNDPIYIKATHPPDPAEDSTTLNFYSEDLAISGIDFYLFVFGVDFTFQPILDYQISFVREDGKNTNQPVIGEETIIRFKVVNRGTEGSNGTYQITKNGTSSVNLIGDPSETLRWYDAQSITIIEYVHVFTDPEKVDFDINIVDDDSIETYTVNNLARREGVTIKSHLTNAPYNLTGTVFQRASGSENVVAPDANVTITNTRTNYSYTTTTDDFGRFSYNLKNLPEGYEEGDLIRVSAEKEGKSGFKEFNAYSEDRGIYLVIVFATYDVRVAASDVRQNVNPGASTTYEVIIFNTGNVPDKFQLSLEGDHSAWGNLDIYEVSIEAGMSVQVILTVTIPTSYDEAVAGLQAHIIVVATSVNSNEATDSVDTYTVVNQIFNFEIVADTTAGNALPGNTYTYVITVINNGNGDDTIYMSMTGVHSSWGELSISILFIDAGEFKELQLIVSIPDGATVGDDAIFMVSALSRGGMSESTDLITTSVDEVFGVELTVGSPTQYGDPDSDVTYKITVYNRGNSQQKMNFTIGGAGNGVISENPIIDGWKSAVVTLTVHIPEQGKANEVINNLISAYLASNAGITSNTISINTVVNEQFEPPEIAVIGAAEKSIRPLTTESFTLHITNRANTDDTFSFSVSNSNQDFIYSVPSLAIASRTSGLVDLLVRAPSNAVFGDIATLEVQAVSSKGLKSDAVTINVSVTEYVYGVELDIEGSEKEKKINLGESVSHTIIIRNSGDYANYSSSVSLEITNVEPTEADWIIDVPATVPLNQEFIEASIFVRVPTTTNTRTSISFNVKAMVNLPKYVVGAEDNPQYTDEIVGIVTIVNQNPQVNILRPQGPSYPLYYYEETLKFEADAFDPDGDDEAITYQWDFGDGSPVDEQNAIQKPTHVFDFPGTYQVTLTVVDEFGESNTAIHTLKVANRKPEVTSIQTLPDGDITFPKGPVTFVVVPVDEDINTLDYTWYFGDGSVATVSNELIVTHTFTRTGAITITCVAYDEFGGFGSNSLEITIENNAPIPSFKVIVNGETYEYDDDAEIEIEEDDEVSFDASNSKDPDSIHGDKIISYNWIFGDGTNGSGVQPTHIYREKFKEGYEVSLTVTDSEGKKVTLKGTILIVVNEKDEGIPVNVLYIMGILAGIVIFLFVIFIISPRKLSKAMTKGSSQAEMASLIQKLNNLEDKLKIGGAAIAGSFAPGRQKFCDKCGEGNEPDGKFCESCGSPLD